MVEYLNNELVHRTTEAQRGYASTLYADGPNGSIGTQCFTQCQNISGAVTADFSIEGVAIGGLGLAKAAYGGVNIYAAQIAEYLVTNPSNLRWIPQSLAQDIFASAGWQAGAMRGAAASRGGWSMVEGAGPTYRIQWNTGSTHHAGSTYWKASGPTIGTQRVPYFFYKAP